MLTPASIRDNKLNAYTNVKDHQKKLVDLCLHDMIQPNDEKQKPRVFDFKLLPLR